MGRGTGEDAPGPRTTSGAEAFGAGTAGIASVMAMEIGTDLGADIGTEIDVDGECASGAIGSMRSVASSSFTPPS